MNCQILNSKIVTQQNCFQFLLLIKKCECTLFHYLGVTVWDDWTLFFSEDFTVDDSSIKPCLNRETNITLVVSQIGQKHSFLMKCRKCSSIDSPEM